MNIYDLVIKNGTLIDPEKTEAGFGHIGIKEGKIAAISNEDIKGNIYIDALGHVVCPGFIDIHAHVDGHEECARLSALQGVTTTIGGNCGAGPTNLKKFFEDQEKKGFIINQGQLIGHSISLRKLVGINSPYIPASGEQIKQYLGEPHSD
jgi:N-acyl-D-amino-acid deacylase